MKYVFTIGLVLLLAVVFLGSQGLFIIIPQPLGAKQWAFIGVTILSFLVLILLHLKKRGKYGLYLFFVVYPFLAQSVFYLNISSPLFILTPAFLFLVLHLMLSRDHPLTLSFLILFLFWLSTLVSVFGAVNKYTAAAFFVLAGGGFAVSAYLVNGKIQVATNPLKFIRGIVLSILVGSLIYFLIETIAFRIGPSEIMNIIMRRWSELPQGRYYTGGYWEPAGLGFVYSFMFWIMLFFIQTPINNPTQKWMNIVSLLAAVFFILVAGTRSVIVNLVNIFIVLWLLRKLLGLKSGFRIKPQYIIVTFILAGISAYILLPRTILTSRSATPPSWIEPTIVSVAGRDFQLVGTTAQYYKRTQLSLYDLLHKPLGAGPLNATILPGYEDSGDVGFVYYYSTISNLIVTGATFGWLSLLLWLLFVFYVTYRAFLLRKTPKDQGIYTLEIVFLAILLASLLPGSSYLGPNLNWSNFDQLHPISPTTPGLPSDYPSIISGLMVGCLIGLQSRVRRRHVDDVKLTNE